MGDLAIIGGGPAGLTAGLYGARAGLEAIVFEKMFPGGQVTTTTSVENFPGMISVDGPTLSMQMAEHAQELGAQLRYDPVDALDLLGKEKIVRSGDAEFRFRAVILCMGATPKLLGVPGEEQFRGRGVSYCATCDGAFYKGKKVAVVGGGDTAVEDALYLSTLAEEVYLIHRRDQLRAAQTIADRALGAANIRPLWNTTVESIQGDQKIGSATLRNVANGQITELALDGLFVAVGTTPQTELIKGKIQLDAQGYVMAGEDTRTNVKGVYAAGDIRTKSLRQIITAAADGAVAVYSAQQDVM